MTKRTSAGSDSVIIPDAGASDCRSQIINRSRSESLSFGFSGLKSSLLSSGLIEPDFDVLLPMLSKMDVGDHVVMLDHS